MLSPPFFPVNYHCVNLVITLLCQIAKLSFVGDQIRIFRNTDRIWFVGNLKKNWGEGNLGDNCAGPTLHHESRHPFSRQVLDDERIKKDMIENQVRVVFMK